MPIIEMKKVFLLGHRQERDKIFNLLHNLGSVEMVDVKSGEAWDEFQALLEPDQPPENISQIDTTRSDIRYCLDFFQRYFPVKKTFIQQFTGGKLELSEDQFTEYIESLHRADEIYGSCRQVEDKLARIRNEITQANNLIAELEPWESLDLPLELVKDGSYAVMGLYTVPRDNALELQESLAENVSNYYLKEVTFDNEFMYFFYAGLSEERAAQADVFKENAVTEVNFSQLSGSPAENIASLHKQLDDLEEERASILREIESLLEHRPMLMACYDYIDNEYKKHDAVSNLARTENSFLLEGWVPAPVLKDLENTVDEKTETAVLTSRDPGEKENVPVLLHNRGPAEAYEVVTKLFSTPQRREVDPTPFMAPFFFIFFGICLGDAGYGILLGLLAVYFTRQLRIGESGKQLLKLLLLGGISSIIFGILFGGYFGDLIKLPPLWFDPLDQPMQMLYYCFAIGLVHIYFGMGVQAYRNIKAGKPLSALFDQGFWFIFLNGLILLLLPGFETAAQWIAIGGGAGLVLTQGRSQSGLVLKFLSGLLSLYNITGYLSDVLSYSRLLALGLATGVIAVAINSMGEMVGGGVVGTVILSIILLGGHSFNIIISALSSYVHTSRLQYVEFFGKFFEGGGKPFKPFGKSASYVDVIKPEEG